MWPNASEQVGTQTLALNQFLSLSGTLLISWLDCESRRAGNGPSGSVSSCEELAVQGMVTRQALILFWNIHQLAHWPDSALHEHKPVTVCL